jgi:hypothetical protein
MTDDQQGGIVADVRFAIVPEWVLDLEVSDRAVRLYALLARHADGDGSGAIPGRKRLAKRLRCSVDSVDRAKAELVDAGALHVEHRFLDGRQTSNDYLVIRVPPGHPGRTAAADEGRTTAAPPGRTGAAGDNESQVDREPRGPRSIVARPSRLVARASSPSIRPRSASSRSSSPGWSRRTGTRSPRRAARQPRRGCSSWTGCVGSDRQATRAMTPHRPTTRSER